MEWWQRLANTGDNVGGEDILGDIVSSFRDEPKLKAQSPEGQKHLDKMLAKSNTVDLPASARDQEYLSNEFLHIGNPDMTGYDLDAGRVANAQAPVGMYSYADKGKSDKYLENHSNWSKAPVSQHSVVTRGKNVFVIGADKPTEGMRQSFIEAMERADRKGNKYDNLPEHEKGYWNEKINNFMRWGDPTGLPVSAKDMNKIFTDNGYDMILRNGDEFVHLKPEQLRRPNAEFDPLKQDSNDLMAMNGGKAGAGQAIADSAKGQSKGFLESILGSLQSDQPQQVLDDTYYGDDSMGESKGVDYTKQFEAIADMPEEIWDGMKTREKVALLTSMIPVVGTGTGVYADVMNMVEDPDERTLVNAMLLASNFIPANQVAKMADRMGITDLYKKTDLGAPRTKEEVEAAKVSGFGDVVQTQKAGEISEPAPIEEITATGKVSNPLLAELRAGQYGDRVSAPQKTKLEKMAAANPVFEQQQLARSGGARTVSEHDLYSQQANWEQMIGNVGVIIPADMTNIRRIEKIGGVEIDPFHTQGGGMHADYTGIWRSMEDAASSKQGHINKVRAETGKDPIMIYTPNQHAGSHFSTMGSEGILHYLDAIGDMTPEGRRALDKYMKGLNQNQQDFKGIPDAYQGYENPEQMLWWLTSPEALKKGEPSLGNRRKAFMQAMGVKDMMQYGAPDINDVYTAINEASMHNLPHGMSGGKALISVDADPKAMNKSNLHGSYNTDIDSQGALTLQDDSGAGLYAPTFVVFPDMAARRADKAPAQRYRSMQTAGSKDDYQLFDEEWYEGINKYYNSLRGE